MTRLFFRYLSLRSLIRAIMGGPDKLAKRELRKKGHGLVRRILP